MAYTTKKPPCNQIESRPGCIQTALDVIGDKWSALLLGQLVSGEKTFGELELMLAGISPRTLSHRLSKLESDNILSKRPYNAHPPRYKYALTLKGEELQGVLLKMAEWGERYHSSQN